MPASSSLQRSLHFSDAFVISCGTVPIDPATSRVLLIKHRRTGDHCLPKGRKNVGESLEAAALRETHEETGYRARLLPHGLATRATPATRTGSLGSGSPGGGSGLMPPSASASAPAPEMETGMEMDTDTDTGMEAAERGAGAGTKMTAEPIAVTQRPVKAAWKIIFWFVAAVDGSVPREEGTQDEGEDFDAVWVPCGEVGEYLTFEDDRRVCGRALEAVGLGKGDGRTDARLSEM